jgi:hypothetical protein
MSPQVSNLESNTANECGRSPIAILPPSSGGIGIRLKSANTRFVMTPVKHHIKRINKNSGGNKF